MHKVSKYDWFFYKSTKSLMSLLFIAEKKMEFEDSIL